MSSLTLNDEKALALYDKLDTDLKAKMVIAKLIEEEHVDKNEIEKNPNKLYIEYKKRNDALIVAKTEADIKAIYNKTITDIKVKLSHEDKDMILAYYKAIYAIEEENDDDDEEEYKEEDMINPIKLAKLTTENKKLREALSLQLAKIATYNKMIISINAKLSPEEKEIIFAYYENEYDEITMTNIEIIEG